MKILLINKFLFPKGGDAVSTLETGKLLMQKGHQVVFWGMKHPNNRPFPHEEYFIDNVEYGGKTPVSLKIKHGFNILYSLEAKEKIKRLIQAERPDIVHLNNFAHQISPSILDVFKKYNIPSVMTMHDFKLVCPAYTLICNGKPCLKCKGGKYYNCFLNKCTKGSYIKSLINTSEMYLHHSILNMYGSISAFIAPSRFMINKINEMGFVRGVQYLSNFITATEYTPSSGYEKGAFLYFGRLSKEKGILTLVKAFKEVRQFRLDIAGEGDLSGEINDLIRKENITNVFLKGYKSGAALQELIRNSFAVILPSECYENNPRSILEAFALGKPAIGSRIGGIPELVIDGYTGYTSNPWDSNDLKEKIIKLDAEAGLAEKMGQNARKMVTEKYSQESHYNKLIEIYSMALKNPIGAES